MEQQGKPLYLQIYEDIKQRINNGTFKPEEQVPPERELCDIYNVSRITVRQAIYEAIKDGLLYRIQGKGTFVAKGLKSNYDPKIIQPLMTMTTFSETLRIKGLKGKTKVISFENRPGGFEINSILNLPTEEDTLLIKLLGYANDDPVALYYSYFPASLGMEMLAMAKEKEKRHEPFSSYELYAELGKVSPTIVDQTFEATLADQDQAILLNTTEGCSLFAISSLVYNANNTPLEFKKAYYRGDRYKFHITREAPSKTSNISKSNCQAISF